MYVAEAAGAGMVYVAVVVEVVGGAAACDMSAETRLLPNCPGGALASGCITTSASPIGIAGAKAGFSLELYVCEPMCNKQKGST